MSDEVRNIVTDYKVSQKNSIFYDALVSREGNYGFGIHSELNNSSKRYQNDNEFEAAKSSLSNLPTQEFVLLPSFTANMPEVVHCKEQKDNLVTMTVRLWEVVLHALETFYFALKVSLLVALPLVYLCNSTRTKTFFKTGSLSSIWGVSNSRLYLGEQISMTFVIYGACIWMCIYGTIMDVIGTTQHEGAWWCFAIFGMLFASTFTGMRPRRLMINLTIVVMMLQRSPGQRNIATYSAFVIRDICIGVTFALVQSFLPYPLLVTRKVDEVYANLFIRVSMIAQQIRDGVWSGRAFSGYVNAALSACDEFSTSLEGIPALLSYCSYEPFERSLWNQLRYKRLALLKRLQVILYATCTSARLVTSMTTAQTRENSLHWQRILRHPTEEYLEALQLTMKEFGASLEPVNTIERCHFDDLQNKKDDLIKAIQDCRSWVGRNSVEDTNAAAFYSFLYFHLMLALLSEEMRTFAEQMDHFDPSTCKSTWRRCAEFFVLEMWNDLKNNQVNRFLLRTEESRRALKDGFKLTCAYCAAAAFTLRLNEDNTADTYYFGMAIIIGIGLPTASESFEVGIFRITGMMIALSVGFLARWRTKSFTEALIVLIICCFIAVCFRSSRRHMQVAFYASFTMLAAYGISSNRVVMMARIVSNTFAVLSYFIICVTLFPINPVRVLWNKRAETRKSLSECITLLSSASTSLFDEENSVIVDEWLKIVQSRMEGTKMKLVESKSWIGLSSNEPIVLGKVFPATHVKEEQVQLQHLTSAIETWLFGLQLLHRPRDTRVNPIIEHIILEIIPLLKNIEKLSRVIFQDLIDCTDSAREWAPMHTVGSITDFVECKQRFEKIFQSIHKEMMRVQDERVRREIRRSLPVKEGYADNFVGVVKSSVSKLENRGFVPDFAALHEIEDMAKFFELPANNPDEIEELEQDNDNQNQIRSFMKCKVSKVDVDKTNIIHNTADTASNKTEVVEDRNDEACEERSHTSNAVEIISPSANVFSSTIPINNYPIIFTNTTIKNDGQNIPELSSLPTTGGLEDRTAQPPRILKSNLSFRTPVWSLPVDTDVTACTVILVSMVAIMSTLEELVPHMYVYNEFARSRLEEKSLSITEFFMHPSSEANKFQIKD